MHGSPTITRIELTAFEITVPNVGTDRGGLHVRYAPGPGDPQVRFAVRILTDEGVIGEYIPPRGRARVAMAACEALGYRLLGTAALERERHYWSMRRATVHIGELGIGPLDVALWDLAGKYQEVSVATMLGGWRERLPAYASTLGGDRLDGSLSNPDAYADFAEQCLEMGYPAYKMHGWNAGDPGEESAMIRAVGERVGGRMEVMYDAACHLRSLADAIRVGRVCDEHELFWYEDPYADGGISIHGHRKLKEHVRTPLLITEHVRNPETTTDILVAGASDFGRVDPDYDGGLTGSWKAAPRRRGARARCRGARPWPRDAPSHGEPSLEQLLRGQPSAPADRERVVASGLRLRLLGRAQCGRGGRLRAGALGTRPWRHLRLGLRERARARTTSPGLVPHQRS